MKELFEAVTAAKEELSQLEDHFSDAAKRRGLTEWELTQWEEGRNNYEVALANAISMLAEELKAIN